jgi:hypothetical protein
VIKGKVDNELCLERQVRIFWMKKGRIKIGYSRLKGAASAKHQSIRYHVTFGELHVNWFCIAGA